MLTKLVRAILDRMLGWYIREQALYVRGHELFIYGDPHRVKVAATATVNNALFNVISGMIIVDDYAFFGHDVALLTGTHDYTLTDQGRQTTAPSQGHDIVIERGVWIGTRAIVIGPCRVGRNAVVATGAVVTRDVPPEVIVAGVPAVILRTIRPLHPAGTPPSAAWQGSE